MTFSFNFTYPKIFLYKSNDSGGCVLVSADNTKLASEKILLWFVRYFQQTRAFGPERPPTKLDLLIIDSKKISAQAMLVLAFLGWILPVMPGTPFFLIAWALGWRPKGSKH